MKLLIATDGSELAVDAAARAGALLHDVDAVTVLAVLTHVPGDDAGGIEGSTETPAEAERYLETEQSAANTSIEATIAALPDALRARAVPRIEVGDAGPIIVWIAEHEGSDVIALGSHGRGVFKRMVLGSVSEHVVHHAPCPVLLVRAGIGHA